MSAKALWAWQWSVRKTTRAASAARPSIRRLRRCVRFRFMICGRVSLGCRHAMLDWRGTPAAVASLAVASPAVAIHTSQGGNTSFQNDSSCGRFGLGIERPITSRIYFMSPCKWMVLICTLMIGQRNRGRVFAWTPENEQLVRRARKGASNPQPCMAGLTHNNHIGQRNTRSLSRSVQHSHPCPS